MAGVEAFGLSRCQSARNLCCESSSHYGICIQCATTSLDFQFVRTFKVVSSYNTGLNAENPLSVSNSLLSQQWQDQWNHVARYNLVALRRGMNVVALHHSRNPIHVL